MEPNKLTDSLLRAIPGTALGTAMIIYLHSASFQKESEDLQRYIRCSIAADLQNRCVK